MLEEIKVTWQTYHDGRVRYFVRVNLEGRTKEELLEQIRELLKLAPDQPEKDVD